MPAPRPPTVTDLLLLAVAEQLESARPMLDAGVRLDGVNIFVRYRGGKPKMVTVKPEMQRELP